MPTSRAAVLELSILYLLAEVPGRIDTASNLATSNYLDLVPKGRDEDSLPFTMAWVRHHDRYADGRLADKEKPYWPAGAASA